MIRINILPKKLKNEAKLKVLNNFFKKIINLLVLCVLLFCLVLFTGEHFLKTHYEEIANQNDPAGEDSVNYSKKVKEINSRISFIKKIQNNEISWANMILKISRLVNDGISVKNLNIDKVTEKIIITGKADTRDNLLIFKNNLEESRAFSEIKLPIKAMLEQTDIEFEINTSINTNEFK